MQSGFCKDSDIISNNNEPNIGNSSSANKTIFFRFCWWNGGGKVKLRLATNPELKKFLAVKPDIFAYGESETTSSHGLSINGYICYLHKSKLSTNGNFRRGMVIFYLTKYRFHLVKVYSSKIYDILWLRLKTRHEPLFFCFFYTPGAHHPLSVRTKFYDILCHQYSRFSPLGKVYLMGDTNARLGHLLNDRNLHGELITNSNQSLLLEFLQYSGLKILNSKFCLGVPTYEIINKKRSIIDLGLTNSIDTVQNFEVESKPFGINSQTCHRAITTTIKICPQKYVPSTAPRRTRVFKLTVDDRRNLAQSVSHRISVSDKSASPDYFFLTKTFASFKNIIVENRSKNQRVKRPSTAILTLQQKFSDAIKLMLEEKSEFSFFTVDNLEKLLIAQYEHEERLRTSEWLNKMNDLDFHTRTRDFFAELRARHNIHQKARPIFDSSGNLSTNFDDTLKNWSEYYKNLYFSNEPIALFPTPDKDEFLDGDLEHSEFLNEIYSLKSSKSPGYDGLTGEDFRFLIPDETPEDASDTPNKIASLKFIFNILQNYWFNESVPQDFKRTILVPFLKNEDDDENDPANYRPISLLNTPMKIYEGMISSRLSE